MSDIDRQIQIKHAVSNFLHSSPDNFDKKKKIISLKIIKKAIQRSKNNKAPGKNNI